MFYAFCKKLLAYSPRPETSRVRNFLQSVRTPERPYCPEWEGDLLYLLIVRNRLRSCLEIGFGTGSTALYALEALDSAGGGELTSIDFSPDNFNALGKANVQALPFASRHALIEENSNTALPRLFAQGSRFDFVYVDGWKTFDHLAMEAYFLARMVTVDGYIMLDDSDMPSVHKLARLLQRYYGFQEIDYPAAGQSLRLRLRMALTHRTLRRPYRAFRKTAEIDTLPVASDWNFFRSL